MGPFRRAYRLFRSEGVRAVLRGAWKKFVRPFDPFYQRVKPAYNSYSVGEASAEFNMAPRHLGRYDFVDDLRSERRLLRRVIETLDDDEVFYDVGANAGIYSCLVGNQLELGCVIAFEPMPEAYELLERNIERNGIDADLFNVALSNENGKTRMSVKGQTGHHFSEDTGALEIETRRADDLVAEHELPFPDVCKIDIEGSEYLALDGFRDTLAESSCHHIFCEIHTDKIESIGGSAEEVEVLLEKLGFDLEYLGDRRENYFVEAVR